MELMMASEPTPFRPPTRRGNGATPSSPRATVRLAENAIQLLEHFNSIWATIARPEHSIEDALRPEYLGHRHQHMEVGDEIVIRHPRWLMKTTVVRVSRDMHAVWHIPLPGYPISLEAAGLADLDLDGARIEHLGDGYRVVLGDDVLVEGLLTEPDAHAWLAKRRAGIE
jgi:hypothetical protein